MARLDGAAERQTELRRFKAARGTWVFVFIGLCFIFVGYRFLDSGLLQFYEDGQYTAFDRFDNAVTFDTLPLLNVRSGYERLDMTGGDGAAQAFIRKTRATLIKTETFDGITVYYAYTRRLFLSEKLSFGKVNLMIAVRGDAVAVGSPLLKGSY